VCARGKRSVLRERWEFLSLGRGRRASVELGGAAARARAPAVEVWGVAREGLRGSLRGAAAAFSCSRNLARLDGPMAGLQGVSLVV